MGAISFIIGFAVIIALIFLVKRKSLPPVLQLAQAGLRVIFALLVVLFLYFKYWYEDPTYPADDSSQSYAPLSSYSQEPIVDSITKANYPMLIPKLRKAIIGLWSINIGGNPHIYNFERNGAYISKKSSFIEKGKWEIDENLNLIIHAPTESWSIALNSTMLNKTSFNTQSSGGYGIKMIKRPYDENEFNISEHEVQPPLTGIDYSDGRNGISADEDIKKYKEDEKYKLPPIDPDKLNSDLNTSEIQQDTTSKVEIIPIPSDYYKKKRLQDRNSPITEEEADRWLKEQARKRQEKRKYNW